MNEEPKEYEVQNAQQASFNGRSYYGPNAADRAELDYLRAWKQWAEPLLITERRRR